MSVNLADRKTFLGGSDAAGVVGLSPWATALDIYFRKVGYPGDPPPPNPQREKMLRRGKLMEPVVIQMLAHEYPIKITKVSTDAAKNYHLDKVYPFMACEIDFEWEVTPEIIAVFPKFEGLPIGSIQNGEVKTVHPFGAAEYGAAETDEIPIQYGVQAMHGIGVTDRQACIVAVLVGSDNLVPYQIMRDDDVLRPMRRRLAAFWNNHVVPRIPPDPVNLPDVYRTLKIRMDHDLQADEEAIRLVEELKAAKAMITMGKDEEKDLSFRICVKLLGAEAVSKMKVDGRHRLMVGVKPILTVRLQSRYYIDEVLLEERFPGASACTKRSTFFVVAPSRKKK